MATKYGLTILLVLVLAAATVSAEDPGLLILRSRLIGTEFLSQSFTGGSGRDQTTVTPYLGIGLVLQLETRKESRSLDLELGGVWFRADTTTPLHGGFSGIYVARRSLSLVRLGAGLNQYFAETERSEFHTGVRIYLQDAGEYNGYDTLGSLSIAPHLGFDFWSAESSKWFFTADLQLNFLQAEAAPTQKMLQFGFGIGLRL